VSIRDTIWNIVVDIALLPLSITFLAFVFLVIEYNQKPKSSHPKLADTLAQVPNWVGKEA
jgi:Na+/phosphate symporter